MFPTDVHQFKRDVSRISIFVSVKVPNCGKPKLIASVPFIIRVSIYAKLPFSVAQY